MSDNKRLAHQFIANAVELKPGEKIWLECSGAKAKPLADACAEEARSLGAEAHFLMRDSGFINSTLATATDDDLQKLGEDDLAIMKTMQGYIRIGDVGDKAHIKASLDDQQRLGKRNIPDGECYSAPVKGSVNGTVLFGPSVYMGKSFSQIYLMYEGGKVVYARGGNDQETANLNLILNSDEGARYPGEFSLAFHPEIMEPVGDVLFDEKIQGSWHFANGMAYKGVTDNGNVSSIHWDKVQIQRLEHGGGGIWIDDRLIRKDGIFVVPELEGLNPARLCGPA